MKINATKVIDSLIPEFDEIEQFHHIRNGEHLYLGSSNRNDPREIAYEKYHAAEQRLNLASDILDITGRALYGAVLAARRWYNRTGWQKCLPVDDAERLLNCMAEQYPPRDRWGTPLRY